MVGSVQCELEMQIFELLQLTNQKRSKSHVEHGIKIDQSQTNSRQIASKGKMPLMAKIATALK